MKSLFSYLDFRHYLADYYTEMKRSKRYFSYRFFSESAGIKSPVFLKLVIECKRNLTPLMTEKFCKALLLSDKQAVFFRHLVQFNQAKTASEKQDHYHVCRRMQNMVSEFVVNADYYDFYNNWFTSVIRELVCLFDFNDDFALIGSMVTPRINSIQVKASVDLLLRLKMIIKKPGGAYCQKETAITTGSDVTALAIRSFNRGMLEKAIASLDLFPCSERYVCSQTIGVSQPAYDMIVQEIQALQERVATLVHNDTSSTKVVQLNIQMFPLSKDCRDLLMKGSSS